jgi:hypothetical protein
LSPILVRPVREQLEHDRVIRLLQAKYKRKFDAGINPGAEQSSPVGSGTTAVYPDLVLFSTERARKLVGIVEVETGESVNHLEAMSQWASFGRLRAPLHLYVPAGSIDTARRLCADYHIPVAELWTYHALGDQMRFTLVQRSTPAPAPAAPRPPARLQPPTPAPAKAAAPAAPVARTAATARRPAPAARGEAVAKASARGTKSAPKAAPARPRAAKKAAPAKTARTQKRK